MSIEAFRTNKWYGTKQHSKLIEKLHTTNCIKDVEILNKCKHCLPLRKLYNYWGEKYDRHQLLCLSHDQYNELWTQEPNDCFISKANNKANRSSQIPKNFHNKYISILKGNCVERDLLLVDFVINCICNNAITIIEMEQNQQLAAIKLFNSVISIYKILPCITVEYNCFVHITTFIIDVPE